MWSLRTTDNTSTVPEPPTDLLLPHGETGNLKDSDRDKWLQLKMTIWRRNPWDRNFEKSFRTKLLFMDSSRLDDLERFFWFLDNWDEQLMLLPKPYSRRRTTNFWKIATDTNVNHQILKEQDQDSGLLSSRSLTDEKDWWAFWSFASKEEDTSGPF